MEARFNAQNSVSPAFQQLYRPKYETVKAAMGKETFTKYVFDVCDEIENRGIANDVDIKFVEWKEKPDQNLSLRQPHFRISKINGDEYIQESLHPAYELSRYDSYTNAVNDGLNDIIKAKEKFLKLDRMA